VKEIQKRSAVKICDGEIAPFSRKGYAHAAVGYRRGQNRLAKRFSLVIGTVQILSLEGVTVDWVLDWTSDLLATLIYTLNYGAIADFHILHITTA
jgi:hypothetical protein